MESNRTDTYIVPFIKGWHGAEISASPSKSYSHRVFIISMLAEGKTIAHNLLDQGDVFQTIKFCRLMGAKITKINEKTNSYEIEGLKSLEPPKQPIDCGNSGTSIRIIASLSALLNGPMLMYGEFFRRKRPMDPLLEALEQIGIEYEKSEFEGSPSIKLIPTKLKLNTIKIRGDISSQFITGLLIMAPLLKPDANVKELAIEITTELKSASYIDITLGVMKRFGVSARKEIDQATNLVVFKIPLGQKYIANEYTVPGDFSSAAFPISFAALKANFCTDPGDNQPIVIKNLDYEDPQPDKAIVSLLQEMGANIKIESDRISIFPNAKLKGITIDQSQTPDLFPMLSVVSIYCNGITNIIKAEHVRVKETDRISVMVRELSKMGAKIQENDDGITVEGPQSLKPIVVTHDQDHRIAMSLAIGSAFIDPESKRTEIPKKEVVADSYPNFFEDFEAIL